MLVAQGWSSCRLTFGRSSPIQYILIIRLHAFRASLYKPHEQSPSSIVVLRMNMDAQDGQDDD